MLSARAFRLSECAVSAWGLPRQATRSLLLCIHSQRDICNNVAKKFALLRTYLLEISSFRLTG